MDYKHRKIIKNVTMIVLLYHDKVNNICRRNVIWFQNFTNQKARMILKTVKIVLLS